MAESRKRRIAKRIVFALAATLMLLNAYVSSYLLMFWLRGRGTLSSTAVLALQDTAYRPLVLYSESDLCGGPTLEAAQKYVYFRGAGFQMPWSKCIRR